MPRPPALLLFPLLLAACAGQEPAGETGASTDSAPTDTGTVDTSAPAPVDADGDGYAGYDDCNDSDARVHPGAHEVITADAIISSESSDGVAWMPAWAGDLDRDGYADIAIGSFLQSVDGVDEAGVTTILYGPIAGSMSIADADAKLTGGSERAWAGYSVAAAGELTGDAYPDLLIGSPGETFGDTVDGVLWVIPGSPR